ncbi:conserved hypothetical protein [Verrucomicrobiia bacterium DG1235]|nr:conserved hypothetical protein [Verrucomicrobiae bacterium DG1235]
MNPEQAWTPLPPAQWDRYTARHLASRIGFSLHPSIISEFLELGPKAIVEKYLLQPQQMTQLPSLISMRAAVKEFQMKDAGGKREMRKQLQKQNREGYEEYAVAWNQFARQKQYSPQEKLCLFFQNVWVVASQGVKGVPMLFEYQNKIRQSIAGNYPEMCKRLTLTSAMGRYLNLDKNKAGAPNENFARELFELFTLGEGNYTEADIKEAARALTGYSFETDGTVSFRERAHDSGLKTVFGYQGRHNIDDLFEIVFEQPAAATFLPKELLRFYLSESDFDSSIIEVLGKMWRESGYSLPFLYSTIFSSQLFYQEEFRGNMIKSPVHYFIGLHQDFEIEILPLPRECLRIERLMGQAFFNPPNVKGWDGGRAWINSATLAARRQVAETLLQDLNTDRLNADELRVLDQAKQNGISPAYRIDLDKIIEKGTTPEKLAEDLFIGQDAAFLAELNESLLEDENRLTTSSLRELLLAAINSPAYQLC